MTIYAETSVRHIKYSSWDFRPLSGFFLWTQADVQLIKDTFRKRTVVFDGEMQMDPSEQIIPKQKK